MRGEGDPFVRTVQRCRPAVSWALWSTTSPCSSRCPPLRTNTGAGTWTFGLRRRDRIPPSLRRNHRLREVKYNRKLHSKLAKVSQYPYMSNETLLDYIIVGYNLQSTVCIMYRNEFHCVTLYGTVHIIRL